MFVLPYSPRWLASKDRNEEAKSTLIRLHGGRTAQMEIVEEEFSEMLAQIEWERENLSTSYMDLVRDKASRHRTACGCLVQAMCQWTGVNVKYVTPKTMLTLAITLVPPFTPHLDSPDTRPS